MPINFYCENWVENQTENQVNNQKPPNTDSNLQYKNNLILNNIVQKIFDQKKKLNFCKNLGALLYFWKALDDLNVLWRQFCDS
jgi:hypothetical protein